MDKYWERNGSYDHKPMLVMLAAITEAHRHYREA